jgi:hydroxymethylbilane synthase
VPTRLEKVWQGEVDAVLLALAGLKRLGLESHVNAVVDPEDLLPAPGQGALAVQIRRGDDRLARLLAPLDHEPTRLATTTERALLGFLEGGCQVPVGALGTFDGSTLLLRAVVASPDGREVVKRRATGRIASRQRALDLGETLGRDLLDAGARGILQAIRAEPLSRAALEEHAP